MTAKVPLKETALNAERIARIGREVRAACAEFDADTFVASVMADLPRLELSARIARTSQGLHDHLPVTGPDALDILLRSLPPTPAAAEVTNDFGLHIYSPHSDYVSRYLRTAEHLERSLAALARMTGYFSAELPVRHFLADFPDETMKAVNAGDGQAGVHQVFGDLVVPLLGALALAAVEVEFLIEGVEGSLGAVAHRAVVLVSAGRVDRGTRCRLRGPVRGGAPGVGAFAWDRRRNSAVVRRV
ncbi:hypothetical protein [Actinacidiphila sp. bgisy167]|uniref:hypothetical protein n=1 Tax=Actinacidiphila sp. bgisy167 TaxID=3413797 RepID=UPI003D728154